MTKQEEEASTTVFVSKDKATQEKAEEEETKLTQDTHPSKKQRTDFFEDNDIKTDKRPSIIHGISVKRAPRIGKEFQVNLPDC
jgi:hypothetical protein